MNLQAVLDGMGGKRMTQGMWSDQLVDLRPSSRRLNGAGVQRHHPILTALALMKLDVVTNPIDIGLLGLIGIATNPKHPVHFIQKWGFKSARPEYLKSL